MPAAGRHKPVAEHRKLAEAFLDMGLPEGETHRAQIPVGDHMQVVENRMPF